MSENIFRHLFFCNSELTQESFDQNKQNIIQYKESNGQRFDYNK